jgi:hypothetical protein
MPTFIIRKSVRDKQLYLLTHVDKWAFDLKIFFWVDECQHLARRRAVITESLEVVRYDPHRGSAQCRWLVPKRHLPQFTTQWERVHGTARDFTSARQKGPRLVILRRLASPRMKTSTGTKLAFSPQRWWEHVARRIYCVSRRLVWRTQRLNNEPRKIRDVHNRAWHTSVLLTRIRHYATSRKVAGSRPDEVNGFYQFN